MRRGVKPTFLIIGAPKTGTTSLWALLSEHPDVFVFPWKGTQFFSKRYDWGFAWYESLFDEGSDATAIGESSANYSLGPSDSPVPQRIADYLPDARLIYMVRNPLERIESHYAQQIDNGLQFSSFAEAVRTHAPLIEATRYWTRINDYRKHFPDEQILVLFLEDFKADSIGTVRRCFEFLGVSASFVPRDPSLAKNTRADKRTDRAFLRWIRRHPAYVKVQWAMPHWVTERLKPWLRKRAVIDVQWDEETRRWILEQIRDDIHPFLDFYGKPRGFWELA